MITYIRTHWKKILLILLVFTIFLGRYEYKMPKRNFADFHVNYYTGQRMLKGLNVYDVDAYRKDGVANFKYPPLFATITALFALTSERTAATIWFIFNFILIIIFIHYSGKLIFKEKLTYKQKNWIYFLALFLTSRFYMQNFDEGQVNFLMMTSLLLGIYAFNNKKELLSGLLIAFSILVKYMGLLFIPYFLFKRRFKLVLYIVCSLIFFSLLPTVFLGWEQNVLLQKQYIPYLSETSLDMHSIADYANQSLMSVVVRYFSNYGAYGINLMQLRDYHLGFLTGCCYIFMYLLCLFPSRNRERLKINQYFSKIDIGLIFVCVALFNPNAWMHAFIFLTFGYMVALFYLFRIKFSDKTVSVLTILSFVLHSCSGSFFTRFWAGELFEILSFVTFGSLVLFVALLKIKFFPKIIDLVKK